MKHRIDKLKKLRQNPAAYLVQILAMSSRIWEEN
jgi:hypothetical protein